MLFSRRGCGACEDTEAVLDIWVGRWGCATTSKSSSSTLSAVRTPPRDNRGLITDYGSLLVQPSQAARATGHGVRCLGRYMVAASFLGFSLGQPHRLHGAIVSHTHSGKKSSSPSDPDAPHGLGPSPLILES